MEICIDEFLAYAGFVGLSDDSDQKVEHDDYQEDGLGHPCDPNEHQSKKFFHLGYFVLFKSLNAIKSKQPPVVIDGG